MNRRHFLSRFTAGVVGAAVLVHLPAAVIKAAPRLAQPARLWACERLDAAYRAYVIAHGGGVQGQPAGFRVGRHLYTLFEQELPAIWQFVRLESVHAGGLMFKGVPVHISREMPSYGCQAVPVIHSAVPTA